MRYTVILCALLLSLFLFGCQKGGGSGTDKEQYFANLYVRFLQEERSVKGTASFFKGTSRQTAQSIENESGVIFFGTPMKRKKIDLLTTYLSQINNVAYDSQDLIFYFNDQQGRLHSFQFDMLPIRNWELIGRASKQHGLKVRFSGGAIRESQELVLLFSDKNQKAHSIIIQGPLENELILTPEQIQDWPMGEGSMYLIKKASYEKLSAPWIIEGQIEYYSLTRRIDIQE